MNNLLKLLALSSALLSPMAAHSAYSVTLNSASGTNVNVGQTLTLTVSVDQLFDQASSDEQLIAFGFNAQSSDTAKLQWLSTSIYAPFNDDSATLNLTAAGSTFPGVPNNPANQQLMLASLQFMALAPGQVSVSIFSDLQDFNQGLIFLNQNPQPISGSLDLNITNVPVPGSLGLWISGLLLLLRRQQRQPK